MSTDRTVVEIATDCEKYWLQTHVPRKTAAEMRVELEQHLNEASLEGKTPTDVVGSDVAVFAEAWASEQRTRSSSDLPTWQEVASGETQRRRNARLSFVAYLVGVAAVTGFGY